MQPICSFPDCGKRTDAQGLCPGHYSQLRAGRPLTPILRGVADRFWAKVEKTETCWLWTGSHHGAGYGHFNMDGRIQKAHRVAWELTNGPIPAGLTIDHVASRGCHNKSCVNPAHLEPVTNQENTLRGGNLCAQNARKTHCPRGHELTEDNIYRRPGQNSRTCRKCWIMQGRPGWREREDVPTVGATD